MHGGVVNTKGQIQQRLAAFVAETSYADLPKGFIERLKWSLLDSLGCGLYGSLTPWGRKVGTLARSQGEGPCLLWGSSGNGVSPLGAVLANGTMVQGFEMDDTHFASRSHPGSITVPTAIACTAIEQGISGKALLTAMGVGYELLARVGACQGISSFDRGWHPTGTAGVFAAASTASKLLGLDAPSIVHALGIAGTMPAGLMSAQYGAMVKRLFAGHTAWVGLSSALLARDGFSGVEDIFEIEYGGYPKALSDAVDIGALTDGLGETFHGEAVGYKLFACVGTNQTTIQAVAQIAAEHDFAWTDVDSVEVVTSEYQVLHSGWDYHPDTVLTAQMNMQYCVAVFLMQHQLFIAQFSEDLLADPQILTLAGKVRVTADPAQDHKDRTAVVTIVLNDGRRVKASCKAARGHTLNPPSSSEIEAKFMALAEPIVGRGQGQRIIDLVANIEDLGNISDLAALLVPGAMTTSLP